MHIRRMVLFPSDALLAAGFQTRADSLIQQGTKLRQVFHIVILSVCRENEPKVSYGSRRSSINHHLVSPHSSSVYKPTRVNTKYVPGSS